MKMTDYSKIESIKKTILDHLLGVGFIQNATDVDELQIKKMIYLLGKIGGLMADKEEDSRKVEYLLSYVMVLWAKLIVEYNVDISEL